MKIKIATRQSELAMYQANFVANEIKKSIKDVEVELIPMTSEGDQTNKPLHFERMLSSTAFLAAERSRQAMASTIAACSRQHCM